MSLSHTRKPVSGSLRSHEQWTASGRSTVVQRLLLYDESREKNKCSNKIDTFLRRESRPAQVLFPFTNQRLFRARYCQTDMIAVAPSPTAVATRLPEPCRTSPAAKTPGTLVSSRNGSRSSAQPLGRLPFFERSGSVHAERSKQQGLRLPLFIFEIVTSTRRLRVSGFLVAFTLTSLARCAPRGCARTASCTSRT
jgi:hypothetical protein